MKYQYESKGYEIVDLPNEFYVYDVSEDLFTETWYKVNSEGVYKLIADDVYGGFSYKLVFYPHLFGIDPIDLFCVDNNLLFSFVNNPHQQDKQTQQEYKQMFDEYIQKMKESLNEL